MATIRELPDALINKIAAGEVIERPASVVKELVENALDAGARRVHVEVRLAGTALIRVADDGCGMRADDLALAVRRHATSKIARFEDLDRIESLGFRGEALPSIGAVSDLEIASRPADELAGASIRVRGGRVEPPVVEGAPAGTTVTVKNLFFNVPARRKFLKTPATEMGHIADAFSRLALAHEGVAFSIDRDGERLLTVPAEARGRERLACVLGADEAANLFEIEAERGPVRVRGLVSRPETTRPTTGGLYLFVNERPVRDRTLLWAVLRGYEGLIDRGRYPVGAVRVEMPAARVDVNVHPAKTEVRFDRPREIEDLVREAVRATLVAQPWLRREARETAPSDDEARRARIRDALASFESSPRAEPRAPTQSSLGLAIPMDRGAALSPRAVPALAREAAAAAEPVPHDSGRSAFFSRLRYIGQARASYLILEGPEGLYILDQHAAHERVTFERLRCAHGASGVASQRLLIPVTVELDQAAAAALVEAAPALAAMGLEIAPFGGRTVAVAAVPDLLVDADVVGLARDLADELREYGSAQALDARRDAVFACMACHSSVRAADGMEPAQVAALLEDLDRVDFSANCPHGRPVVVPIAWHEIEKRLDRV